jgi:hypothetical protein
VILRVFLRGVLVVLGGMQVIGHGLFLNDAQPFRDRQPCDA